MKRIVALLLILTLCAAILPGCGAQSKSPASPLPTETPLPDKMIVDGAGRALICPDAPETRTIASVYAVSVPFLVALRLTDRVRAINTKSIFWTDADANLDAAGTIGRGRVDLEALALVAPDVLVHRSNDPETVEAVTALGVDVFCITVEDLGDILNTLAVMGRYFGAEARAAEVSDWLKGKFAKIETIVSGIPAEERVTALVMGGELGRVAGGDMLQTWMIERAGGLPVAAGTENGRNWMNAGVETVFGWNPDVLFLTSSTALEYSVDKLLADDAWSAVSAVRDCRVYQIPAKIDSWDMPGMSCALATMFMLRCMYPDFFSAEELRQEIDEYYTFLFGRTFDAAYLGYGPEL